MALNGIPTSWEPFIQDVCARDELPNFDQLWTNCVQEGVCFCPGLVCINLMMKKIKPLQLTQGKEEEGDIPTESMKTEDLL